MQTLVDLALRLDRRGIERAINEADKYDLVHPPDLRKALELRVVSRGQHSCEAPSIAVRSESLRRSSNGASCLLRVTLVCRSRSLGSGSTASKSTSSGRISA
ncbi:MAG TPA: hypothetical protein VNM38_00210, partial [Solirubrobacterales bacterium]|nr:hypothetical protein [Solirubrobacterales bacterium]